MCQIVASHSLRRLLVAIVLTTIISIGNVQMSFAQEDSPESPNLYLPSLHQDFSLMRNSADPNFVFSEEHLAAISAKEAKIAEQELTAQAAYLHGSKELSVGTWQQPSGSTYVNYCGPGATQVALDARLSASQVPSLSVLGTEEAIDPNWGVYMHNICPVLNNRLSTAFYVYAGATSATQLSNWIINDIDSDYALVTGVKTTNMPGWGGYTANHIVAVYGYQNMYVETSGTFGNVKYTDTASSTAGYGGAYRQNVSSGNFWSYVSGNSAQCW